MNETARVEQLLDALDTATAGVENTEDLRAVAGAADTLTTDEARLTEAVEIARAHGRSWTRIGIALGVSRQAARQRFADKTAV
ncbi:MAG: sigma-70 family RNA polymerase sigma factor [Actinomycetota bacterium]|nr:sigma-70 family RNA polymerase sigma factor [Actinomycetota bacterium]